MKNLVSATRSFDHRVLFGIATFLFITSGVLTAQAGQSYQQIVAQHPDWVQVPGELIRPDCVHQLPAGAIVSISDDPQAGDDVILNGEIIAHYDNCPEEAIPTRHLGGHDPGPVGNGWVEDAEWVPPLKKGDNIEWIQESWAVPSAPKSNGALIFFFNGLQPLSGKWIIQPVLQYGVSYAGGGNYWAMASWMVGPKKKNTYVSTLKSVNTGDVLIGSVQQTGAGSKLTYIIDAYDDTTAADSQLSVWSKGIKWAWAFSGVLEAYNVKSCSNFPASGSVGFAGGSIAHGYPSLDYYSSPGFTGVFDNYFGHGGPSCSFSVSVSGADATLKF